MTASSPALAGPGAPAVRAQQRHGGRIARRSLRAIALGYLLLLLALTGGAAREP